MRLLPTIVTFLRHVRLDPRLREQRRSIRSTDPETLAHRYGDLSADEFGELNGPQCWLDARLIPRALRRRTQPGPWRMIDLGCGSGDSTALLLAHAPEGSTVLGYDLVAPLLALARERDWPSVEGAPAAAFVHQSVTGPLRATDGSLLPEASIDVAHAAGFVGHHLDAAAASALLAELARVLADDGTVVLDSGPRLHPRELTVLAAAHGLRRVGIDRVLPWQVRAALSFERAR